MAGVVILTLIGGAVAVIVVAAGIAKLVELFASKSTNLKD